MQQFLRAGGAAALRMLSVLLELQDHSSQKKKRLHDY
jgi:hypothetical protein